VILDKKWIQWLTLILLAAVWGSSFILMKKSLVVFDSVQVASFRLFIAFAVMLPIVVRHFKVLKGPYFWPLLVTGVIGNGIPAFLFAKAQTVLDSSLAGILNSLVPLFALILGWIFFRIRSNWINVIGVLLGLLGASGLIFLRGIGGDFSQVGYALLVVVAALCYATSVNVIKKHLKELNSAHITGLALVFLGPISGVYLLTTDFTHRVVHVDGGWLALLYVSILGIVGTSLAILLFNMLIKRTSTLFATSVTYLIPVVAILWGLWDGEIITYVQFGLIASILGGVYLVNKS